VFSSAPDVVTAEVTPKKLRVEQPSSGSSGQQEAHVLFATGHCEELLSLLSHVVPVEEERAPVLDELLS